MKGEDLMKGNIFVFLTFFHLEFLFKAGGKNRVEYSVLAEELEQLGIKYFSPIIYFYIRVAFKRT